MGRREEPAWKRGIVGLSMARERGDIQKQFQHRLTVTRDTIERLGHEATLHGHMGCVNCLEWNKDGSVLASASDDLHIILWDPYRHKKIHKITTGHTGNIFSVKFLTPDILATCAADGMVRARSVSTGTSLLECSCHCGRVKRLATSPENPSISWSAGEDGLILSLLECSCHCGRVKRLATSPENPSISWSAGEDGLILQHDMRLPHRCNADSSNVLVNLLNHMGRYAEAKCVAVNPRRAYQLAVGANDFYVRLYDTRMIKLARLQVSENCQGGGSSSRMMWERQNVRCARAGAGDPDNNVPRAAVHYFAPGHLTMETGEQPFPKKATTYVAFSHDGNELLVNLGSEQVYLYDINSARRPMLVESFIIQHNHGVRDRPRNGHARAATPHATPQAGPASDPPMPDRVKHLKELYAPRPAMPHDHGIRDRPRNGHARAATPHATPQAGPASDPPMPDRVKHLKELVSCFMTLKAKDQATPHAPSMPHATPQAGPASDPPMPDRVKHLKELYAPRPAMPHDHGIRDRPRNGHARAATPHATPQAGPASDPPMPDRVKHLKELYAPRTSMPHNHGVRDRPRNGHARAATPHATPQAGPASDPPMPDRVKHLKELYAPRPAMPHNYGVRDRPRNGHARAATPHATPQAGPASDPPMPDRVKHLKELANDHVKNADYEAAIQLYNRAIADCPRCAVLYSNRAAALMRRGWSGDIYAAIQDCYRAIKLDPGHVKSHFRLAKGLMDMKRAREAHECLLYFKDKFPRHSGSHAVFLLQKDINVALEGMEQPHPDEVPEANTKNSGETDESHNTSVLERQLRASALDYSQRFLGHCNTTTDIKEASFLGPNAEYIAAGSDDGCLFIWCRRSGNIVRVLRGDESIVNCVQLHPACFLLATSGIEAAVRLWSPQPEDGNEESRVVEDTLGAAYANQRRMRSDPFEAMLLNISFAGNPDRELQAQACRPS
ncbi:WD and tetratricopeptide repeats protein 1 [Ostrinia nubilalis]|uniref:WD and tetratricopeptide repeats protein 1 n=1 Tax=Ostrinia nubilalis TaxID=29057 RepID=UPI0030824840